MSLDPILWAMKDAPIADVEEWAILSVMAESADEDGCNAFQSTSTIAERTRLSDKTVQRRLDVLVERGLLAPGDQQYAKLLKIPVDRRPTNYDLQIPFTWWGNPDRVNDWRRREGRPPLTASDRPPLGSAPEKKRRKDWKITDGQNATVDGDSVFTISRSADGGTTSHPVTEAVSKVPGGTVSPGREDYESPRGGSTSHPTHPSTNLTNPPPTPGALAPLDAPQLSLVPDADIVDAVLVEDEPKTKRRTKADDDPVAAEHRSVANAIARRWVDINAEKAPVLNAGRTVITLAKSYIVPALEAGYTENQVKHALQAAGDVLPPMPAWRRALLRAAGGTVPVPASSRTQANADYLASRRAARAAGGQA